jgi:hypothetical protein
MFAPPLKKGWLVKQGAIRHSWKRRFFVLGAEGDLFYFDDDKVLIPKGFVYLCFSYRLCVAYALFSSAKSCEGV